LTQWALPIHHHVIPIVSQIGIEVEKDDDDIHPFGANKIPFCCSFATNTGPYEHKIA